MTQKDGEGNTTDFRYNAINKLTKTVPKFGTTTYTYDITSGVDVGFTAEQSKDQKGNITTKVFDKAGRIKYVYDGTVSSKSKTEYNYYDNGNRKNIIYPNGFKEEYTYYKDNLLWTLKNYKKSNGTDVLMDSYTYIYDGAHNQSSKVEVINGKNKGTTSYLYDTFKVVLEMDATGKQTGRNIYGTNLLMRKAGNDTLYYMYNGHADVTVLIDATTGVVRGSYYYDAFGNVLVQKYYTASGAETSQKINNSITYAGYQYDDEGEW